MSAKSSRPAPAREAASTDLAPQNLLAELSRQQLALATESACALFRGSEAMRKIQQQTAHQASLQHEAAAQKLRGKCEPADLLAIQSDLLRFDLQEATRYWQQLAAAALQTQVEMMGCASHLFDAGSQKGLKPVLETVQTALVSPASQIPAAFKPVLETWQAALAAPATQMPAAFKPVLDTWQAVLAGSLNSPGNQRAAH